MLNILLWHPPADFSTDVLGSVPVNSDVRIGAVKPDDKSADFEPASQGRNSARIGKTKMEQSARLSVRQSICPSVCFYGTA
jgi:hypothetical protein